MGLGAMIVRGALVTVAAGTLYAGVINPLMGKIRPDNTPIEKGYVSPKSLSVEGKKNGQGNIETYLQYKSGDEVISLPCAKGPSGPLCGKVDYWWQSIGGQERSGLVTSEWPVLDNAVKRGIVGSELDAMLDSFYGNGKQQPPQQLQYKAPTPPK